jgi:small-conductance mechanosensitive channel
VDAHEQYHLDEMARQMAKVKARTRPWRAIIALVLATAAGILASAAARDFRAWTGHGHPASKIVTAAATVAFCLFAIIGILDLARRTRQALQPVAGSGHAAVVRYTIVLAGAIITFVIALALVKVPVGQLVLGGALTTILIGIAAQQSLSNVFAGLVLLLSRPFFVGEAIQLRSGAMGGLLEGTVTEIGITYLRLETADGPISLPNSQVLAAAVGRPKLASHAAHDGHGAVDSNHEAAPSTPADAPATPPGGQQAAPADVGLASSAGKRQLEEPFEPHGPGSAAPPS